MRVTAGRASAWTSGAAACITASIATFFEPARQIARMDRLGIDRTVVSFATPLVNYYLDPKLAVRGGAALQRRFAALVARNPARFAAWAFLPMQDPSAAAAELRRCVREHGFVGGHVATNVRGTTCRTSASGRSSTRRASSTSHCSCIRPIRPAGTAPATTSSPWSPAICSTRPSTSSA